MTQKIQMINKPRLMNFYQKRKNVS